MLKQLSGLLLATISSYSVAVEIYDDFPPTIHPDEEYVFYSHGLIVEGSDPRPVHPEFGTYEFPEIIRALFNEGSFNLVAHHRPAGTDPNDYAAKLVGWVHQLVDSGVQPSSITLVGFSRGAQITLNASSQLAQLGINTAVMAVCFDGDFPFSPAIELSGRVLSIYETSDTVRSCDAILARSDEAVSTAEIAISTGKRHGAFYTPLSEWMVPLKAWLNEN